MIEKLPVLSPYDVRIVMQDQYELRYGLFNHAAVRDRPLASVAMHPCEDTISNSMFSELCEEYAMMNYKDMWGLSLDEFLHRPMYEVAILREITDYVAKKRVAAVDTLSK